MPAGQEGQLALLVAADGVQPAVAAAVALKGAPIAEDGQVQAPVAADGHIEGPAAADGSVAGTVAAVLHLLPDPMVEGASAQPGAVARLGIKVDVVAGGGDQRLAAPRGSANLAR